MRNTTRVWLVVLVAVMAVAWTVPALGDVVADKRQAQNKLLAQRAARADAIRKLAERIRGLFITSETYVRDFVAESDAIETEMVAFLSGMKEVGKPRHTEDGTCEVVMEVKLNEIIVTLKRLHKKHYKGNKVKITDFDKMTVTNEIKVIRETGSGVPRPELVEEPLVQVVEGELSSISNLSGAAKAYWMARVTGRGRLMAVRAARVDAMRRLGERISGVFITSETMVRDFVAESDDINVDMTTFLVGAREKGIRYHGNELIVEVEVAVTLREVLVRLKSWAAKHYKGNKVRITQIDKLAVKTRDTVITEVGMGVPPEKYLKNVTAAELTVISLGRGAPPWVTTTMKAVGNAAIDVDNANAAQAKLMAYRGAELDARRKLAERIDGLMITSETSVYDFVTANDEIETAMLAFQQGVRVLNQTKKLLEDGTVEIAVEIDLKPLWNRILYYQKKLVIIKTR